MKEQSLHSIKEKNTGPDMGDISIFLIGVRKIVQISTATYTALLKGLTNLQTALDPRIAQVLKVIAPIQMSIYGFYTLFSSIAAAKKLYHLHTNTGPYKDKPAYKKKKIKTTIFTGSMALSDISVFIFTIFTLVGVTTVTSPAGIALILINGLVNLTKYSLKFFTLAFDFNKSEKSIKDKIALKYRLIKNVIKFSLSALMMGAMAAVLFIAPPFSTIVAASMLILWSVGKLVYKHAIRPKLEKNRAAEEAALSDELDENDFEENKHLNTSKILKRMKKEFSSTNSFLDETLKKLEEDRNVKENVVEKTDKTYTSSTFCHFREFENDRLSAIPTDANSEAINDRKAVF